MNVFARYGYDVWTMDFEGYGKSTVTAGNSDIASGVADLRAATPVVARETGQERFHFMGGSSGAIRAAAFATAQPSRVDRLVLEAFTYTGKGSPTLAKRAEQTEYYRSHNRRPRDADMIRSIFTRDKPGTSDQRVAEAMAKAEMPNGDTVPTGTYLDMTAHLPLVDPREIQSPVLMVRGQYDEVANSRQAVCGYSWCRPFRDAQPGAGWTVARDAGIPDHAENRTGLTQETARWGISATKNAPGSHPPRISRTVFRSRPRSFRATSIFQNRRHPSRNRWRIGWPTSVTALRNGKA
jgi:pimeloyl-ACP methyl ester carboxylesterase